VFTRTGLPGERQVYRTSGSLVAWWAWVAFAVVLLVVLAPHFHGNDRVYAYAIGILAATGAQLALAFGALGRIDFRLQFSIDWHDPRIRQVFTLMLPVTIGLGIVNLDQLINSAFGSLVSDEAPRAIDNAFRIYMLPQGMFSVAVATVLFPVLSRLAARAHLDDLWKSSSSPKNGMRIQIFVCTSAPTYLRLQSRFRSWY